MTLTEFLLARIAEVEKFWTRELDDSVMGEIAHNWLAECEAKRRIVEVHRREPVPLISAVCPSCRTEHERNPGSRTHCAYCGSACQFEDYLGPLLALPYADHPDYREEWRP